MCPVFYCVSKCSYFEEFIRKVSRRIYLWQNKLSTFSGRIILIKHVLQSMPIHLLSALCPPKGVIKSLHRVFAKFFWANTLNEKRRHWSAWDDLSYPVKEGGLGLKFLLDINKALIAKLWWNFRISIGSLWSIYMGNNYCKKMRPSFFLSKGASLTWEKIIRVKEEIEPYMWWQLKGDNFSF